MSRPSGRPPPLPWWTLPLILLGCQGTYSIGQPLYRAAASKADGISSWEPGDVIPGWEGYDYDCPVDPSAGVVVVNLPNVWYQQTYFGIDTVDGSPRTAPIVMLTDCEELACDDTLPDSSGAAGLWATGSDTSTADFWHLSGIYGDEASAWPDRTLSGTFTLPVGSAESGTRDVQAWMCVSRARPDQFSGVVHLLYHRSEALAYNYFEDVELEFPMDLIYEDHSGLFTGSAAKRLSVPEETPYAPFVGYQGGVTYDEAWDWDAITDPDIRAEVYDRYTPTAW